MDMPQHCQPVAQVLLSFHYSVYLKRLYRNKKSRYVPISGSKMAEEDQTSHFDDPEEEPIKVLVTFKPQEQETDENHNNFDQPCNAAEPSSEEPLKNGDDTCNDSETEEPSLPVNPPVTPIPSFLEADKANSRGHDIEKQEVLEVNKCQWEISLDKS